MLVATISTCFVFLHVLLDYLQGHQVDDHDPQGAVQQLCLVLYEGQGGDALEISIDLEILLNTKYS